MRNKTRKPKPENQDHNAAADEAKFHLRNDKDLNKAYPLDEKTAFPKSSPKGT